MNGIAGIAIMIDSFLQSLTRYASPASAMLERLKEYQMEQPAVLRWRIPTSSVRRT